MVGSKSFEQIGGLSGRRVLDLAAEISGANPTDGLFAADVGDKKVEVTSTKRVEPRITATTILCGQDSQVA